MTKDFLLLGLFIIGMFIWIVWIRKSHDKQFVNWMDEVKLEALEAGYDKEAVDEFDMADWENYFNEELTPREALAKQFSK